MPTLKQGLIVGCGVLVAAVMIVLGLWQMSSYRHSGLQVAIDRTNQPPVALLDNVAADGTISDIYARRVTLEGTYRADQVLVGTQRPWRVVTALELPDGRVVAVVRGATSSDTPSPAPTGRQQITGIFLASDPEKQPGDAAVPPGTMPSLRLPRLAQQWDGRMIAGYVTLPEADSRAQGLAPAEVPLPEVQGSAQHSGYAMQWWVFAAAAIGASIWIARGTSFSRGAASSKTVA